MIFDLKDALLLATSLITVVYFFVSYVVRHDTLDQSKCKHCFAEYQSRGVKVCVDCGFEEPIIKPHYPQHQR